MLATAGVIMLGSCEQETYDTGTGDLSLTRGDLLEAHADNNKTIVAVTTDSDEQLILTNPYNAKWVTTADSTYRVMAYYDKTGEGAARLVSMRMVPTLIPVAIEDIETPKTDPIRFESLWVSDNRKYVNIGFYIMTGTPDDDAKAVQTLGAMYERVTIHNNGTTTAKITIYHDQGGVPEYYSTRYYASLPVSTLHDADSLTLVINSYKGRIVKTCSLR